MSAVPELVTLRPTSAAVVRERAPMNELSQFYDRAFRTVATVATDQGVEITGPPFAMYYGIPTDVVDVAAGFPTGTPVAASDPVTGLQIPGGRAAQLLHVGAYEGLADAYGQLMEWLAAQGLRPSEVMWESYLNEPPTDAGETAQTLITVPVVD